MNELQNALGESEVVLFHYYIINQNVVAVV